MPVLYVHGVNTRSHERFLCIEPLLRRLVAPAISDDPDTVPIQDYYWGDLGINLAWDGASRPRTRLLGMGAGGDSSDLVSRVLAVDENERAVRQLPTGSAPARASGGLASSGLGAPRFAAAIPHLSQFSKEELSDLLAGLILRSFDESKQLARTNTDSVEDREARGQELARQRANLLLAVDTVVADPQTYQVLAGKPTGQELDVLLELIRKEAAGQRELAGMGVGNFWSVLKDRAAEAVSRANETPGYLASTLAAEIRPKLNELVSNFIGDVFVYLKGRDDPRSAPGRILTGLATALKGAHHLKKSRNGEPLVVLSHSMGGQLIWDAVTWLLPSAEDTRNLRIDFWCATASQVGFFEEAKLFAASESAFGPGKSVPFPSRHLGVWWNVWDHNDFLSFTAKDICAGVDDGPYDSGSSLVGAHGAYLDRPSFYRAFARKLAAAKANGFKTP